MPIHRHRYKVDSSDATQLNATPAGVGQGISYLHFFPRPPDAVTRITSLFIDVFNYGDDMRFNVPRCPEVYNTCDYM